MVTFFLSLALLIFGYFTYGVIVEKIINPQNCQTPAVKYNDSVDYIPMKTWKVYLIQLLNIAGTGPIFGALMGATFGPVVYLWIVFGSIFAGGVHDYLTGMISLRSDGIGIPEIIGKYLGKNAKIIMRVFAVLLLVLVGTVFTTSPATLIAKITPNFITYNFCVAIILIYYVLATLLPIDKVIGKIYPVFGVILIIMVVSILCGLIVNGYNLPEMTFENLSVNETPIWPYMFITVACGAISGFHSTQSPLMARCIKSEKNGRVVFYGAMITEGVIALIWACAGVAFYETTGGLQQALNSLGQSGVVYEISTKLLGTVGSILAIIGVIVCPISSGDTAFRSARLIISDWFKMKQVNLKNRLIITIPLLLSGAILTSIDFNVIWRYFSWSNQALAMFSLWAAAVYLAQNNENKYYSLVTSLPACFMSAVSMTYILTADEGLGLSMKISYSMGFIFAIFCFLFYIYKCILTNNKMKNNIRK